MSYTSFSCMNLEEWWKNISWKLNHFGYEKDTSIKQMTISCCHGKKMICCCQTIDDSHPNAIKYNIHEILCWLVPDLKQGKQHVVQVDTIHVAVVLYNHSWPFNVNETSLLFGLMPCFGREIISNIVGNHLDIIKWPKNSYTTVSLNNIIKRTMTLAFFFKSSLSKCPAAPQGNPFRLWQQPKSHPFKRNSSGLLKKRNCQRILCGWSFLAVVKSNDTQYNHSWANLAGLLPWMISLINLFSLLCRYCLKLVWLLGGVICSSTDWYSSWGTFMHFPPKSWQLVLPCIVCLDPCEFLEDVWCCHCHEKNCFIFSKQLINMTFATKGLWFLWANTSLFVEIWWLTSLPAPQSTCPFHQDPHILKALLWIWQHKKEVVVCAIAYFGYFHC